MENQLIFLESRLLALELLMLNSEELKLKYISILETVKSEIIIGDLNSTDSQLLSQKIERHLTTIGKIEPPHL